MLLATLSNVVCLHYAFLFYFLPLIFANAFCFHALSWFIDTYFAYFMHQFASCTVLLIFLLLLLIQCSHRFLFFLMKGLCALW